MILKTRHRSYEWMTEERLFTSGLKVCPNNAKVRDHPIRNRSFHILSFPFQIYYNIAKLSADQGDNNLAFAYYHKAIE